MRNERKVIILAAGTSQRLAKLTHDIPKCLLPVGENTILGRQLDNVRKAGLTDVVLSVGYKAEKIEEYIKPYEDKLRIHVEFNPFFDISNNIMSLWNIRHLVRKNPILIVNGDNVFDYRILTSLMKCPHDNVLMVQVKEEYDGDDMKVQSTDDRLIAVNKSMKSSAATGESIGIMKFSVEGSERLMQKLENMSRTKENLHVWYLRAIQELVNDRFPIHICNINGLPWEEVDFPEDIERVRQQKWQD